MVLEVLIRPSSEGEGGGGGAQVYFGDPVSLPLDWLQLCHLHIRCLYSLLTLFPL